jgi:hypothetical protein
MSAAAAVSLRAQTKTETDEKRLKHYSFTVKFLLVENKNIPTTEITISTYLFFIKTIKP